MDATNGTRLNSEGCTERNKVSVVCISEEERQSGIPSAETVGEAVGILQRDGLVVLDNAVCTAHVDALHRTLAAELPDLLADAGTHYNGDRSGGNISQAPPLDPALMFPDVWTNAFAAAVIAGVLGPRPHVSYVNGNTALPRTHGRQRVHADLHFRYPGAPFAVVANYYLSDTTEANGATEVWLRSHRDTHWGLHDGETPWIKAEHLEARAQGPFPPIRPSVKRGSVVLRDLRLWHAGRSNPSAEPRAMLAFVHFPWWYRNAMKVRLPEAARPMIEAAADRVVYDAEWVATVDHKKVEFNANFESGNAAYNRTRDWTVNGETK